MKRRYFSTKSFPWDLSRAQWLASGRTGIVNFVQPQSGKSSINDELNRLQLIIEEERAKRKPRTTRPVRVREHNILNAFREPHRLVEFSRPLPLPRLIGLISHVWQEAQQVSLVHSTLNTTTISTNENK